MLLKHMKYSPVSFDLSREIYSNPWRGYYRIARYLLADQAELSDESILNALDPTAPLTRLVLLEINLSNYRNEAVSQFGLEQLNAIFDCYSRHHLQLIVRFLYDWDGFGLRNEPEQLKTILGHMEQVGPYIKRYSNYIFVLQGLFIGSWGEMHDSKFLSADYLVSLTLQLLRVTGRTVFLSVRSPAFWRVVTNDSRSNNLLEPFDSILGIYNDGMFGSETDLGTFLIQGLENSQSRSMELDFLREQNCITPYGGEVISGCFCGDFSNAVKDLVKSRVSYLNRDYDPLLLNSWKNLMADCPDSMSNTSQYDYIADHLGYRFEIVSCRLKKKNLFVRIKNSGFAPPYKSFSLSVHWTCDDGTCIVQDLPQYDVRLWNDSADVLIPLNCLNSGIWQAELFLFDHSINEIIHFANIFDGRLGQLRIK